MIRFLHIAFPLTVHQCYCHCLCHAPTASQTLVMASTPSPFSDKHTGLLCHSVIQQAWERERESGEGNRSYASMHSFYLTSLWCETAQYSGFGAAAFPDQWRLNTLSWGPCSGMVEMQIFHAPEIKSFHYLLNPKENIFFLPFSPTGTQVPAWSDERERCTDPNACSTRVSAESLRRIYRLLKTFSGFNSLSQLSPKSLPKQSQWKQHICDVIAVLLATFRHTQTTEPVDCQWKRQISPFLKYTVIEASYQQQACQRWSFGESPVFVWSVLPDLKALWFYFPVTWRPPLASIRATTATRCRCPTRKCKNES